MTEIQVKKRVREKFGWCCAECGRTNQENINLTGRSLHVHRLIPGSEYDVSGCTLLCASCHVAAHGGSEPVIHGPIRLPQGNTPPRQFRLDDETMAELDAIVKRLGVGTRTAALKVAIRNEYARGRAGRPPKGASK